MSSFVINKKEYMKAAGLMAGLAQELQIWSFDYETHRNRTPEDYKKAFEECFTMNAISVSEQYKDSETYTDSNDYTADFNEYKKLGCQLVYNGGEALENAIYELMSFFDSCIYQTEKDAYMFKMQMFFDSLIVQLFKKSHHKETESWSELKIEKPKTRYSRIY